MGRWSGADFRAVPGHAEGATSNSMRLARLLETVDCEGLRGSARRSSRASRTSGMPPDGVGGRTTTSRTTRATTQACSTRISRRWATRSRSEGVDGRVFDGRRRVGARARQRAPTPAGLRQPALWPRPAQAPRARSPVSERAVDQAARIRDLEFAADEVILHRDGRPSCRRAGEEEAHAGRDSPATRTDSGGVSGDPRSAGAEDVFRP